MEEPEASDAIQRLNARLTLVQAAITRARARRDAAQRVIDALVDERRDLWRERRLQRIRERKAADGAAREE